MHGPANEARKQTESVSCTGAEPGLHKCRVDFGDGGNGCKLSESVVSVSCVHDSLAACPKGEVPWGGSCYSMHFEKKDFFAAQVKLQKATLPDLYSYIVSK